MLIIRKEQMDVFKRLPGRNFEDRMFEHLRASFPKHCELLEESTIRKMIKLGQDRATNYHFVSERGVTLFIELMFLFGSSFHMDPQLSWAEETLTNTAKATEDKRTEMLYNEANAYLITVSGRDNEHISKALHDIRNEPLDEIESLNPADLENHIHALLHKVFPSKYNYLGKNAVQHVIEQGKARAFDHGLTTSKGAVIYIGLQFMLGSDFDTDPQYFWANDILAGKAPKDPEQKTNELYQRAKEYLDHWIV